MARDGGNLILTNDEADNIKRNFPESSKLIKRLYGANEFLNSHMRWCIWISDEELELAKSIQPINERISNVYTI